MSKKLKKARTRALRRTASDATEDNKEGKQKSKTARSSGDRVPAASKSSSSSSSFSSSSSSSGDEDVGQPTKSSGNRGKGKAKAKADKEEKKKTAVKKKARAAADKFKTLLDSVRTTLAHECSDDLADEIVAPQRVLSKSAREIHQLAT